MKTFAIAVGTVLLLIGAVIGLLATVVATVCPKCEGGQVATIAIVLFFMIAPLCAWAVFSSWQNIMHARNMQPQPRREQPIEATYRELPYQRPQAQLPAPQVVTVPRYYEHGVTRPMVHLQTQTETGETLTVPLSRLSRFLALPTPSRAEWTGDRSAYGDCLEFCLEHGLLDRTTKGGVTWRAQYPLAKRSEWAAQWMVEDENN